MCRPWVHCVKMNFMAEDGESILEIVPFNLVQLWYEAD